MTLAERCQQVGAALLYGLLPSWAYERTPHYDCGYWRHAAMNLAMAWRWATWGETAEDLAFADRCDA